jgi:hypothetical protein
LNALSGVWDLKSSTSNCLYVLACALWRIDEVVIAQIERLRHGMIDLLYAALANFLGGVVEVAQGVGLVLEDAFAKTC